MHKDDEIHPPAKAMGILSHGCDKLTYPLLFLPSLGKNAPSFMAEMNCFKPSYCDY